MCTWNVLTLLPIGSLELLDVSLTNHSIDVACLQETRIRGDTKSVTRNYQILTSGYEDKKGLHGVGIAVSNRISNSIQSWQAISARICAMRINAKPTPISILSCYAPTEDTDSSEKDDFYMSLQRVIDAVPKGDALVIGGDMNAKLGWSSTSESKHIGRFVKPSQRNDNGDRLALFASANDLSVANTMYQKKKHQLSTWTSRDRKTKNQIDFFLIKRRWRTAINDIRTRKDNLLIDSDHQMLKCKIKSKLKTYTKSYKAQRFNIEGLRNPATARQYCQELRKTAQAPPHDSTVNKKWEYIRDAMIKTAKKTIGKTQTKSKPWISQETLNAIKHRESLKNKGEPRNKIKEQRKHIKKLLRRDKNKYIDDKTADIELANEKGHTREMYRLIRTLGGCKKHTSETIKNSSGQRISDTRKIMERWAEHFVELLNADTSSTPLLKRFTPPVVLAEIDTEAPTKNEITHALRELQNRRAGGCDGIPPELYKEGGEALIDMLKSLLDDIWDSEQIPDEWRTSVLLPFHKKGDTQICSNYRGISLLCIGFKLLETILLARLTEAYEPAARDNQAGFRKKRGCRDQVFAPRQILEQRSEFNRSTVMTFIDFKAAFDSVNRNAIWQIFERLGMPQKIANIIRNMYTDTNSIVKMNNNLSDPFPVRSGVRQGGVLSPFLFNLLIDWVMHTATEGTNHGIQLETLITDLDYADDICLLEDNSADAQALLDRVLSAAVEVGLKINAGKTKCMLSRLEPSSIYCNGCALDNVAEFDYLGSRISHNGDISSEIQHRIARATANACQLNKFCSNRDITIKTKSKVYKACVRSALLYGAETWTLRKADLSRLDAFENRCARKFFGGKTELRSSTIRSMAHLGGSLDPLLRQMRLKWCGHVFRMTEDKVTREALMFDNATSWKRPPGGMRKTWRTTVAEDLEPILKPPRMRSDIWKRKWKDTCSEIATDRPRWRAVVRDAVSVAGNGQTCL